MNEKIVDLIEENYPFSPDQLSVWKETRDDILCSEEADAENVISFDKLLSKLGDGHTRIRKIIPPRDLFVIDLIWAGDKLIWVENMKGYPVNSLNGMSVDTVVERYRKDYGLNLNALKKQIVVDIKNGQDLFSVDSISIGYRDKDGDREKTFFKTSLEDIKATVSPEQLKQLKNMQCLICKKTDANTLYFKMSSFYDDRMADMFIDALKHEAGDDIENIIIDIRDNLGGYVDLAKRITGLLIDKTVEMDYEILDHEGNREKCIVQSNKAEELKGKKIWLFVNGNTQSCAEYIFARALSIANDNLTIIGSSTAALSGQAKEFILNGSVMLSVSTKRYVHPGTDETVGCGVIPSVVIESFDHKDITKDKYIEWYTENKTA